MNNNLYTNIISNIIKQNLHILYRNLLNKIINFMVKKSY